MTEEDRKLLDDILKEMEGDESQRCWDEFIHREDFERLVVIRIRELQTENAKLRSVLGFFADKENWVCKTPWPHDCKYTHVVTKKACETLRQKACEALGGEK